MDFIKQLLSIEERKISTLLIIFVITVIYSLYTVHLKGDIPQGLLGLVQALTFGVVGMGGINALQNYIQFKNNINDINSNQNEYDYYNQYFNNLNNQQNSSNWSDRI
jgi:hypothetical protein